MTLSVRTRLWLVSSAVFGVLLSVIGAIAYRVFSHQLDADSTATLVENASPANMIEIIETYKATISFTSPTGYRAMMAAMDKGANLSSLLQAQ